MYIFIIGEKDHSNNIVFSLWQKPKLMLQHFYETIMIKHGARVQNRVFKKNSNTLGKKVHSTFDILKEVQYS